MNLRKVGGIIAVANHEVAKPLLQVGQIPIIRRIVITYQQVGVFPIVVVVGGDDEELKRELSALGVIFLKHEQDRTPELMDSVRTGLRYLQGKCSRVVFAPVNVPMFTPDTLQTLLGTAGEIVVEWMPLTREEHLRRLPNLLGLQPWQEQWIPITGEKIRRRL